MDNLLIRVPNHLGDTLMAQPALKALAESGGYGKIYLLGPVWAKLLYSHFSAVEIIPLETEHLHGLRGVLHQTKRLQQHHFDSGVLLTPSFSSALAFFLAGVKRRFGYTGDGRGWLLTDKLPRKDVFVTHRSRQYFRLVEKVSGNTLPFSEPRLIPSPMAIAGARKILEDYGFSSQTQLVVIPPQAVAASRRWGSSNYAELARRLTERNNLGVVLLGTAAEKKAGEIIARDRKRIVNLCGKTDISLAAAILSLATLFIGNDSGLAHLAAAVDIPLVVLSGADRPSETSPLSNKKTVIIKDYLDCISCVKNRCRKKGNNFMRCMREISVDEVYAAACQMME